MASNIEHVDKLFNLLKKELKKYDLSAVTKSKREIADTPFVVLISCILSLRTKDKVTEKASIRLLGNHETPEKILALSEDKIQKLIYPVGFYKTKAKRIREMSKTIIEEYGGKVPSKFEDLLKLKGVGRKTANIVMVFGHKKHGYIPVDVHCHRIPNRIGWIQTKTPEETEYALKRVLPEKYWDVFNDMFVTFGQNVCLPISPICSKCPIEKYCKKAGVDRSR